MLAPHRPRAVYPGAASFPVWAVHSQPVKFALAPINPTIGDVHANAARIADAVTNAASQGATLVASPELAVSGYPPKDLLLHEGFVADAMHAARSLATVAPKVRVVVGCPWLNDDATIANALLVLHKGRIDALYRKQLLPTYDVFDEDRYFTAGDESVIIEHDGLRIGLSVCEDLWRGADAGALARYAGMPDPVANAARAGADLLLNPSASPFVLGKGQAHRRLLQAHAATHNLAVAALNQLGGNDDLIFDGHAAIYVPDPTSHTGARLVAGQIFSDHTLLFDLPSDRNAWAALPEAPEPLETLEPEHLLWNALVLGVRDYCRKTGFSRVILGLSGGIDSALTACIAAAALGPANVLAVGLPSRYSSEGSLTDARSLAETLGLQFLTTPIAPLHNAAESTLTDAYAALGLPPPSPDAPDVAMENVQSRIRGLLLMAFSNRTGALLLTTGNKSELAVGYCTLYGDMNGGLAVISDVTKAQVYNLSRWINANPPRAGFRAPPIPESTITKAPSAELRPDQTDQDTLPPYDVIDEIVSRYVEHRQSLARIAHETRIEAEIVERIARMIDVAEFKRKQTAVGLKVSSIAFGPGRRVPIAQRWRPRAT